MIVIRHAREADVPGILHCLETAFAPFRRDYSDAGFRDTVLDAAQLRMRMTQMSVFVAERNHEVAGTIAVATDGDEGHLRGMAVLPSCEHGGIGRRLVRRALDELTVSGCRRATLGTTAVLVRAAKFYESAGFTRTGRVSDFFGMPLYEYASPVDDAYSIREATLENVAPIRRVINEAYRVERDFVRGDRIADGELRDLLTRGTFLVATRTGEAVSACVFLQPKDNGRTYLGLLAVDPAMQGRRLGALIMAAAERWCRQRRSAGVDIRVVNLRTELPPFYEARGFVPAGTEQFQDARLFKEAHFNLMTLRF
jgi:N-acetylglutamate synthase-like GNAT family acetyltransferase